MTPEQREAAAATARSIRRYPNLAGSQTEVDLALALLDANERLTQALAAESRIKDAVQELGRHCVVRNGKCDCHERANAALDILKADNASKGAEG
jgi:predicted GTPase